MMLNFLQRFQRKHSNALCIRKSNSGWSRVNLHGSILWAGFTSNKSCLCISISPFTIGLYVSSYDYAIHVVLIATSHMSLITSFQPPLTQTQISRTICRSAVYTYPKPILAVDISSFVNQAFHYMQMAYFSCYMHGSPLMERSKDHCISTCKPDNVTPT